MINFQEAYYRKPYARNWQAELIARRETADGQAFGLSETIFYPEGGGQPADHGYLSLPDSSTAYPVRDVQLEGETIWHILPADCPLEVGQTVRLEIDWPRRFELMQQHSAEHMISGIANRLWSANNVGFHIGETEMTLDFDVLLDNEQLIHLERLANEAVWQNLPFEIIFPTTEELETIPYRSKKALEGAVRLIRVPGIDCCACCGTHLSHSGEIGQIQIIRCEKYKKGVRLTALAGSRALAFNRSRLDEAAELSARLSKPLGELTPALEQVMVERDCLRREVVEQRRSQLAQELAVLAAESGSYLKELTAADSRELTDAAKQISGKVALGAALGETNEDGWRQLTLCAAELDLGPLAQQLRQQFGWRGGGRGGFLSGQFQGDAVTLREVLRTFVLNSGESRQA